MPRAAPGNVDGRPQASRAARALGRAEATKGRAASAAWVHVWVRLVKSALGRRVPQDPRTYGRFRSMICGGFYRCEAEFSSVRKVTARFRSERRGGAQLHHRLCSAPAQPPDAQVRLDGS